MTKQQRLKELREYLSIEDKRVLDIKKYGIDLIDNDEVFVLVNNTKNYWISNHGRLINNLRGKFYFHKPGNPHSTLTSYHNGYVGTIETYRDKLVAEHFLENVINYNSLWHIDGDKDNCYYKNLIWVNNREYIQLNCGSISIDELGRQQEYIPYISSKGNRAYSIWNGIYLRCYKNSDRDYKEARMCDLWRYDKKAFVEWYNSNYYECDGESMAVDKDLLFPGNKEYSPDKCCIIPQTINTMLSNCKKHYKHTNHRKVSYLPMGVRCDTPGKYYGQIKPFGCSETIKLSFWNTPEEAFAEYKRFKQADILLMALKYKNKIPKYIYDALLKVDVKSY